MSRAKQSANSQAWKKSQPKRKRKGQTKKGQHGKQWAR